ncbi:MAG: hypothetical protein JWP22_746 [Ramlibacter sp.]|jgi:hypothetical protein|nr:hypothetical protein [Ramlibacter sp.]MDB5912071.1 hypothetical protein [Ramlibacter sp.]
MGMLEMLLGRKRPGAGKPRHSRAAQSTQFAASQVSQQAGSVHSVRKDLLKLVLRETLTRNGIPGTWMTVDLLRTTNSRKEQGVHVRFLVREWVPKLMEYGPALEQEFVQRLVLLDPQALNWLMGFSWQFSLDDISACPRMPHPGSWTASRDSSDKPAPEVPLAQESGDIIAGPVFIAKPVEDVRADLERLLALRDDDMKRHGPGGEDHHFAPTRPAML